MVKKTRMGRIITTSCCFCVSTRIGCIVVGVLGIVSNIVSTALLSYRLHHQEEYGDTSLGVKYFTISWYAVYAATCFLLIYGAIKSKEPWLLPWLLFTILSIIFSGVAFIMSIRESRWLSMCLNVAFLHLFVYSFVVVYSHYYILKAMQVSSHHPLESTHHV